MRVSISNASVEFDGISVLTSVDFDIKDGEKIALVGRNGCGKTTLLRAITGQVELSKGTSDQPFAISFSSKINIGYLSQVSFDDEERTMHDEILSVYDKIIQTERAMEDCLAQMQENSSPQLVHKYSRLSEEFELLGGYLYKKEYLTAVAKFGFSTDDLQKKLNCFSGGQRTKIALLRLLLSKPDLLLLDEPTNHLDLSAITWLEGYIKSYPYACVIVSHDRLFLDRTVGVVYEIEYGESKRYKGNYSAFLRQKRDNYLKERKDMLGKKAEIERLMKIVEKFRYKKSKAAMAQAKLTQIKRMGVVEMPRAFDENTFHASFAPTLRTSDVTIAVEKLQFGYNVPLGNLSFEVARGDKLGIIGANGCGKSTLVKTLVGKVDLLGGTVTFGANGQIGYFDQTSTQSSSTLTVLEDFLEEFPKLSDTQARSALGAFLLTEDNVFKQICELSGGERVRYFLCKILKRRPNILILDEPTNHMDIVGKETFEDMLQKFDGTVVLVSHDRYLINAVCNRLLVFDRGNIEMFNCSYEEYEQQLQTREAQSEDEVQSGQTQRTKGKQNAYREQKERQSAARKLATTEGKIAQIEQEIEKVKCLLYGQEGNEYQKAMTLTEQLDNLNDQLDQLLALWEQLHSIVED